MAQLNNIEGVAIDGYGKIYIADWANYRIRQLSPTQIDGVVHRIRKEDVALFPNPNTGEFTINIQTNFGDWTFEIYNTLGERLYKTILTENVSAIRLIDVSKGIYFYRVFSTSQLNTGKFILE